jgi:hypothetical protein
MQNEKQSLEPHTDPNLKESTCLNVVYAAAMVYDDCLRNS